MIYNLTDFEKLGYSMKTKKYEQTPDVRNSSEKVIGRDGEIIFTDGFDNKQVSIVLSAIDDADISTRRANADVIRALLVRPGKLVLDYEQNKAYNARVLKGTTVKFNASYDEISVTFNLDPFSFTRFDSSLTWDEADIDWGQADFQWVIADDTFELSGDEQITISNDGNYESSPVYVIESDGDVTFTHSNGDSFTITPLSGIINVDAKQFIVYDDSKVNKITTFSGDFITLDVGDNVVDISGSFTALTLSIENKDFYV